MQALCPPACSVDQKPEQPPRRYVFLSLTLSWSDIIACFNLAAPSFQGAARIP
jgi:hypothetical protein